MRLLSVAQLNTYLRELLDTDEILADIWVEGEVSNLSRPASGHCYFTLKEADTQLRAVCWRSAVARIPAMPVNGDAVLAHGRVAFYEASGQIQLYVDMIRPAGVGLLAARFAELKARLAAEGLFDPSRKRSLPPWPRRIGIVTSPTGAALQDMLTILRRRFPLAEVLLAGCQVQGVGAAESVVAALQSLYQTNVDVIIVARGGGSAEDLWTFNEEVVARAVYASPVPVVSGVGHETDTTIIDEVADLRAPTPSAAAELVTPDQVELRADLEALQAQLDETIGTMIDQRHDLLALATRNLHQLAPAARLEREQHRLHELMQRATAWIDHATALRHAQLAGLTAQLSALSPQATLARGYAIVRRTADGSVVTVPSQVATGDMIGITLRDGELEAQVRETGSAP
ncbi:MAG TPA: exodeoxyribonuclease VII large subunit [Roseiflexaceae bacterium]|nr:exodeoxyribonuclease VII large subunit [Roseiflexaceae bacterium]HMP41251.1 exodeoxyribonuclease VII large subunit [Roseiflexaceae bacterium]